MAKTKAKIEKKFIRHGDLVGLPSMLMAFRTPTFGDTERIRKLIKLADDQGEAMRSLTQNFFKENNIAEGEVIEQTHPLYVKLSHAVLGADTTVTRENTAVFTQKEFNSAVDGKDFSYSERSFLQEWLVKEIKDVG